MDIEANVQSLNSEDTIPYEPETYEVDREEAIPDIAPQISENSALEAADSAGNAAAVGEENTSSIEQAPFLTIRYNHKDRTLSREEAITAAQKGIRYGEVSDKLEYLALSRGCTASELLDTIADAERTAYRNSITERLGDDTDTIDRLMRLYDMEQSAKYGEYVKAQDFEQQQYEEDLNRKLAEEFMLLKSEFPEISDYSDLPAEVRKAAENGKELMPTYLLHRYREEKRISAAKVAAQTAAASSIGSMAGQAENEGSDIAGFKAGFWN